MNRMVEESPTIPCTITIRPSSIEWRSPAGALTTVHLPQDASIEYVRAALGLLVLGAVDAGQDVIHFRRENADN